MSLAVREQCVVHPYHSYSQPPSREICLKMQHLSEHISLEPGDVAVVDEKLPSRIPALEVILTISQ